METVAQPQAKIPTSSIKYSEVFFAFVKSVFFQTLTNSLDPDEASAFATDLINYILPYTRNIFHQAHLLQPLHYPALAPASWVETSTMLQTIFLALAPRALVEGPPGVRIGGEDGERCEVLSRRGWVQTERKL